MRMGWIALSLAVVGCSTVTDRPFESLPWQSSAPSPVDPQPQVDVSDGLDVEEAVVLALENNPRFQGARLGIDFARARKVIAETYPYNPEFGMETSRALPFSAKGDYSVQLSLSQTLETGGKRGHRIAAAEADIERSAAALVDDRRLLRAQVVAQFYELLFLEQRQGVGTQNLALAQRLLEVAEARFVAKQIPEIDVNLVRLDHGRANIEKEQISQDAQVARANLAALIGQPDRLDFQLEGEMSALAVIPDRERLHRAAEEHRPDLRAARAQVRTTEERVRLARALAIPDVTVGLTAGRERSAIDSPEGALSDVDKIVGISVSVPLPLINTRRGERLEAEVERRRALADVETIAQEIRRDVGRAVTRLETGRTLVESYERDLNRLAQQSLDDMLRAYKVGEVGTLQVLRAQEDLNRVKAAHAEAQFAFRSALADLEAALGTPLSEVK